MGEFHPLPVPDNPWDVISVDFISELPEANGKDCIMVVVDSVTKRSHFINTVTTISAVRSARLYVKHVWKHHGLPQKVISDCGPQFVAEFTRELYRLLGIELAATTAYHPQGDRQTERVNQELKQYLRVFINQRQNDWDELLPFGNSNTTITSIPQTAKFRFFWTPAEYRVWDLNPDNDRLIWRALTNSKHG